MGVCTYPYSHVADAFMAEARACGMAIQFAQELGFRRVQFEGDSLAIIKKLQQKSYHRSLLCPIITAIKQILEFFLCCYL